MKVFVKASLLALAALWAGAALAGPGGGNQASHMEQLAILLDLTDTAKIHQVQGILQGEHAQMKTLFEQTKAAGGKPDFQSLHAARQQIHQDTLTQLSGVLTPLQLKKFETLQQMHHGFGHHGPPAGAPAAPTTN